MPIRVSQHSWNTKKPWDIDVLSKLFDVFPIFTKKPVRVGEPWTIQISIHIPKTNRYCVCFISMHHCLEKFVTIGKTRQAVISYRFCDVLETKNHPEMLESDIHKRVKPTYTFTCHGLVYFSLDHGVIMRREQCIEWTKKWTDTLDTRLVKWKSGWELDQDFVYSTKIMVELLSKQRVSNLIKRAKEDKITYAKTKAAKCACLIPKWKYFLEKRKIERDKDKKDVFICRAFVYYGPGVREIEGQFRIAPNVVYIDENHDRLAKSPKHGPIILPMSSKKFTLVHKSSYESGITTEFPMLISELPEAFDILPLKATEELRAGLNWSVTLYVIHSWKPALTFPVIIRHKLKGYEKKENRHCAVIRYIITGEFKADDYPERFDEIDLSKNRLEIRLRGNGLVFFDQKARVIVGKQQTVSLTRFGEYFDQSGKLVSSIDEEKIVSIRMSLLSN